MIGRGLTRTTCEMGENTENAQPKYSAEKMRCLADGVVTEEELAAGWPFAPPTEPTQIHNHEVWSGNGTRTRDSLN